MKYKEDRQMLQGYGSEVSDMMVSTELAYFIEQESKIGYSSYHEVDFDVDFDYNDSFEPTKEQLNSDEWLSANGHPGCSNGICSLTQEEIDLLF